MFDIGFAELMIIGVVALIVIGPERLPEAVRTGSAWLNRLRRGFNDIKQEVQQELHNDEVLKDLRESGAKLRSESEQLRKTFNDPLSAVLDDSSSETLKAADKQPQSPAESPPQIQADPTVESFTESAGNTEKSENIEKPHE